MSRPKSSDDIVSSARKTLAESKRRLKRHAVEVQKATTKAAQHRAALDALLRRPPVKS